MADITHYLAGLVLGTNFVIKVADITHYLAGLVLGTNFVIKVADITHYLAGLVLGTNFVIKVVMGFNPNMKIGKKTLLLKGGWVLTWQIINIYHKNYSHSKKKKLKI